MLITTLNHNLPELTDNLYNQVLKSKRDQDEIIIVDNGSKKEKIAKTTTHRLEENVFFGGGLNVILDYFLNETNQDYLMVLNNDLIFHGYKFIQNVETELKQNDLDIYSPSIIDAQIKQCYWNQMHNWGSYSVRNVKWVDFQAPVLSRRICNIIKRYPDTLMYGWGNDMLSAIICEENKLKIGVSDLITVTHLESQTIKTNNVNLTHEEFNIKAKTLMDQTFSNLNLTHKMSEYWNYGKQYEYK